MALPGRRLLCDLPGSSLSAPLPANAGNLQAASSRSIDFHSIRKRRQLSSATCTVGTSEPLLPMWMKKLCHAEVCWAAASSYPPEPLLKLDNVMPRPAYRSHEPRPHKRFSEEG